MLCCFCWNKTGGEIISHIDFVKKNVILWIFQISLPLSIMIPLESCPRSQLLVPFVLVSISHTWLILSIMAWGVIMEQWSNLLFYFPDTLNTTQSVWQKLHYSCFKKICLNSFRIRLKIHSCINLIYLPCLWFFFEGCKNSFSTLV